MDAARPQRGVWWGPFATLLFEAQLDRLVLHTGKRIFATTNDPQPIFESEEGAIKFVRRFYRVFYRELSDSYGHGSERPVLLHGDLHSFNIILQPQPGSASGAVRPVLIDFGDAHFGIPEAEFGAPVQEWWGTPMWEALLYRNGRGDGSGFNLRLALLYGVKRTLWAIVTNEVSSRRWMQRQHALLRCPRFLAACGLVE